MELIVLVHLAATLFMTGLIWFVQVVHYPLLAAVSSQSFVDYHAGHMRRTSWIVGPVMLVEALTASWLLFSDAFYRFALLTYMGAVFLALIWLSTALLQIPHHESLRGSYTNSLVERLVLGNWLRTVLWTSRSVIALLLVVAVTGGIL